MYEYRQVRIPEESPTRDFTNEHSVARTRMRSTCVVIVKAPMTSITSLESSKTLWPTTQAGLHTRQVDGCAECVVLGDDGSGLVFGMQQPIVPSPCS